MRVPAHMQWHQQRFMRVWQGIWDTLEQHTCLCCHLPARATACLSIVLNPRLPPPVPMATDLDRTVEYEVDAAAMEPLFDALLEFAYGTAPGEQARLGPTVLAAFRGVERGGGYLEGWVVLAAVVVGLGAVMGSGRGWESRVSCDEQGRT